MVYVDDLPPDEVPEGIHQTGHPHAHKDTSSAEKGSITKSEPETAA